MCDCDRCEQLLQPFLDRQLDEFERAAAEEHLGRCSYCRRRYVFEEKLRMYVRQSAVVEPMPPELKERLAAMRIAL
jgi:anti-sigma factor (TIGR02949 family)